MEKKERGITVDMVEQNVVRRPHSTARATGVGKSRVLLWKGASPLLEHTQIPMSSTLVPTKYHTHCFERNKTRIPIQFLVGITVFKNHNHLLPWQWNGMPIWQCHLPSEKLFFVYYSPHPGMKWTFETRPLGDCWIANLS